MARTIDFEQAAIAREWAKRRAESPCCLGSGMTDDGTYCDCAVGQRLERADTRAVAFGAPEPTEEDYRAIRRAERAIDRELNAAERDARRTRAMRSNR